MKGVPNHFGRCRMIELALFSTRKVHMMHVMIFCEIKVQKYIVNTKISTSSILLLIPTGKRPWTSPQWNLKLTKSKKYLPLIKSVSFVCLLMHSSRWLSLSNSCLPKVFNALHSWLKVNYLFTIQIKNSWMVEQRVVKVLVEFFIFLDVFTWTSSTIFIFPSHICFFLDVASCLVVVVSSTIIFTQCITLL